MLMFPYLRKNYSVVGSLRFDKTRLGYVDNLYCFCKKIVPGWYYSIIPFSSIRQQTPWYFTVYPESPCKLCCRGVLVKTRSIVHKTKPKEEHLTLYEWEYVELGIDADKHDKPLGLVFTKGKSSELPRYIRQVVRYLIKYYTKKNVITKKEALKLAKEQKTETPHKSHLVKPFEKTWIHGKKRSENQKKKAREQIRNKKIKKFKSLRKKREVINEKKSC